MGLAVSATARHLADDERERFSSGLPFDRRTRNLDVRDGPFVLGLAPQRKSDGTSAKHFFPALLREEVLELDIAKTHFRFGHQISDDFVALTDRSRDDYFRDFIRGCINGRLRFGNGKRNFPLHFLRRFLLFLGLLLLQNRLFFLLDDDWLSFRVVAARRRASGARQD
jgi:hypothetical protein